MEWMRVSDPYYGTQEWRALRDAVRRRSGGICEVPGCKAPMAIADHVIARKDGGPDTLSNLRALCLSHDAQIMQRPSDGKRRNGGKLRLFGADTNGDPLAGWAAE